MAYKTIIRDNKHLKFIRQLECVLCGSPFVEAAHLRIGTDGATSMKPSDCWVLPLCSSHHRLQHQIGERTFWEGRDPHYLCAELYKLTGLYEEAIALIERERVNDGREQAGETISGCW